jgi:ankyrin repeat protein
MDNPFLLAADNDAALLPLLRATPGLASAQDEFGYSLVHAAASYNHLDLLRALVRELGAPVDMRDQDGETALFVVETVDAARVLVEELGADVAARNADDPPMTAREKIEDEAEFPRVAAYLAGVEEARGLGRDGAAAAAATTAATTTNHAAAAAEPSSSLAAGSLPEGVRLSVGAMDDDSAGEVVDPEFRRRIEELAQRDDFASPEGQAELRRLVEEALGARRQGE